MKFMLKLTGYFGMMFVFLYLFRLGYVKSGYIIREWFMPEWTILAFGIVLVVGSYAARLYPHVRSYYRISKAAKQLNESVEELRRAIQ